MDDEDDLLLQAVAILDTESQTTSTETTNPNSTSSIASNSNIGEVVVHKSVSKTHCILVNQKQKGNPLLKAITCVPWEFDEIIPDYVMGPTTCALFLSLKYHNMNPDYIHERLKLLGKSYELRVLLVLVDLSEPHLVLKNLTRICLLADLTLMLAWNSDEAGKIIETYKIYQNKPPDKIMERIENDPHQKIVSALSSLKPVNKTDAMTLLSTFGSLENMIKAPKQKLAVCPGFGTKKASQFYKVIHEPFIKTTESSLKKQKNDDDEFDIDENELESALQECEKPVDDS